MTWVVVVKILMEIVETDVVEKEIVGTEAAVPEVVLIEVVVVQFESALLICIVPQWDSSGHTPLPAK